MKLLLILCAYLTLLHVLLAMAIAIVYSITKDKKAKITLRPKENSLPTFIHRRIKIDKEFSHDQKREIIHSLEQWKDSLHGIFDFSIVDSNFDLITEDDHVDTIIFLRGKSNDQLVKTIDYVEGVKVWGYAYFSAKNPAVILLMPDRIGSLHDFKNISLHEIGHTFGMNHTSDRSSVMAKYYIGADKLTHTDLSAFFSVCLWDQKFVRYHSDPFWVQGDIQARESKTQKYKEIFTSIN